jgi:hypothetical protein
LKFCWRASFDPDQIWHHAHLFSDWKSFSDPALRWVSIVSRRLIASGHCQSIAKSSDHAEPLSKSDPESWVSSSSGARSIDTQETAAARVIRGTDSHTARGRSNERFENYKKMEITRAISADLTGRSRCNQRQTIKLWPLDPAEQVPRDASGFA